MAATLFCPAAHQPKDSLPDSDSHLACRQACHLYTHNSAISSPRQSPTDISHSILEEENGESESESPIEPITPVSSARLSRDFPLSREHHQFDDNATLTQHHVNQTPVASHLSKLSLQHALTAENHYNLFASPTSAPDLSLRCPSINSRNAIPASTCPPQSSRPTSKHPQLEEEEEEQQQQQQQDTKPPSLSRRSTSSFKRTMSSLFRRTSSNIDRDACLYDASATSSDTSVFNRHNAPTSAPRSFPPLGSYKTTSTASNSPPSPGSPLEMTASNPSIGLFPGAKSLPEPQDFGKKIRTSTGFTLRGRVNLITRAALSPKSHRRASSVDAAPVDRGPHVITPPNTNSNKMYPVARQPWALPPDAGTGSKARRMSLILPDDFTIDIAELLSEFEYQHKILGRHGKHLGKGAASKVSLMARKGFPNELYAVKEFRGKSKNESTQEYEKKIKSEFSIAKSLHHPNIVETIRLCTDHGRWNHVMEYCSEGDLFGLVQKGFFKGDGKLKDRLCIFKQLVQGVAYLHSHGIAHRDIKLENLLITKDSKIKITDFGVSEVFSGTHPGLREAHGMCGQNMGDLRLCSPGICGSEPYIAPEVLAKSQKYDPRALDVWSAAIVVIYLNFGGAIWSRAEPGNTHYDKLVKGWERWYKDHPDSDAAITDTDYPKCLALDVGVNPPALRRVLLQMLNPDPAKRMTTHDVMNNRWVRNIECCQVESYDDAASCIDATKKNCAGNKKIFCHNHLPPKTMGSHSLGKMPGQPGY